MMSQGFMLLKDYRNTIDTNEQTTIPRYISLSRSLSPSRSLVMRGLSSSSGFRPFEPREDRHGCRLKPSTVKGLDSRL